MSEAEETTKRGIDRFMFPSMKFPLHVQFAR